jgi:hypothetical protein
MGSTSTETRSLRLPSQEADHQLPRARGPFTWILIALNAVAVGLVMVVYLVIAPLVALGTGLWQIVMEVRETAMRPSPFVGARHGFPFLDPRPPEPQKASEPE